MYFDLSIVLSSVELPLFRDDCIFPKAVSTSLISLICFSIFVVALSFPSLRLSCASSSNIFEFLLTKELAWSIPTSNSSFALVPLFSKFVNFVEVAIAISLKSLSIFCSLFENVPLKVLSFSLEFVICEDTPATESAVESATLLTSFKISIVSSIIFSELFAVFLKFLRTLLYSSIFL